MEDLPVALLEATQGDLCDATTPAAATAAVTPAWIAGWIAQRQPVTGRTMGAVK